MRVPKTESMSACGRVARLAQSVILSARDFAVPPVLGRFEIACGHPRDRSVLRCPGNAMAKVFRALRAYDRPESQILPVGEPERMGDMRSRSEVGSIHLVRAGPTDFM
jgi:hypothetical protein